MAERYICNASTLFAGWPALVVAVACVCEIVIEAVVLGSFWLYHQSYELFCGHIGHLECLQSLAQSSELPLRCPDNISCSKRVPQLVWRDVVAVAGPTLPLVVRKSITQFRTKHRNT